MRAITIVTSAVVLSCTPGMAQTSPKYVPSSVYRAFTCDQLAQEGRVVSKRGFAASGLRAGQGGSNATTTASAIVIVWPEKAHGVDKQQSDNLALADGQMNAIEQASVEGQCSIRFQRQPAS
jgi:hypothetical protein